MHTCEIQYEQHKIETLQKNLREVCKRFNGAEQYVNKRIEELCSKSKLSVEKVTYLFMNDYDNF